MNEITDNDVLTVAEAASFLRVSESIVRRLIKEKRVPYFQIEGRYLLYRPELEKWIEKRMIIPSAHQVVDVVHEITKKVWSSAEGERGYGSTAEKKDPGA